MKARGGAVMRSIWSGVISFGLVNIPVELCSAINRHTLGFKLLHAACNTPLNYRKWCAHCKADVAFDQVVKGIKMGDSYITITPAQLKKMKLEKTDIINIVEFVDKDLVSPLYYDTHYYVIPEKKSTDKAFYLLGTALSFTNKVAIGSFVLRDKQYVCAIQAYENVLLLSTLNYAYEIRDIPVQSVKLNATRMKAIASKGDLELAEQLIKKLTKKTFDISSFKDTFADQLKKYIQQNSKKLPRVKQLKKKEETAVKHASLTHMLQSSLKQYAPKSVARK